MKRTDRVNEGPTIGVSPCVGRGRRGGHGAAAREEDAVQPPAQVREGRTGRVMRTSILRLHSFLPLRYLALSHDHEHNN
jgi:hypothetical protein